MSTFINPNGVLSLGSLFTRGDHILIDKISIGWILDKYETNNIITFKIEYDLTKFIEEDVNLDRIEVINVANRETGVRTRPSTRLQSDNNSTMNTDQSNSDRSLVQSDRNNNDHHPLLSNFNKVLAGAFSFKKYKEITNMQLFTFLKDGKNKSKGWLREVVSNKTQTKKTNLKANELNLMAIIGSLFGGYTAVNGEFRGFVRHICHAFGVSHPTFTNIIHRFIKSGYTMKRKTRKDIGETIFNCDRKRKARFTTFNAFKKRKYNQFRETTDKFPEQMLKDEFETLPESELRAYEILAQRDYSRAEFLWDELKQLLLRTKGKISYKCMRDQLGSIVSENTIRKWLKMQDGFRLRRDRILPALDNAAKLRRLTWCHSFWLFWMSATLIPIDKAIMALVHMDEKWFYAVRTRCNTKVLTSIGLEANDYYAHHKNHIGKEMYICVTAFVLNNGNDIRQGGIAVPIAMIRVGAMVAAKKDTFKRVYRPDGTFHYPKIESNRLRKKGEMYFKGMELTGSSEGTEKKPKISLLNEYKTKIIPAIEEKVVARFNNGGERNVIVLKQEDGAGLHTDKTYLREMKEEFWVKRKWLLFNQSSQSPTFNVHDMCIFPMLSKAVSREQALTFGSTLLKGEQLNQTVMKVWSDESNLTAIARSFAGHWQIVLAAMHHKGDNIYLKEKGGLSFGIRRTFIRNEKGDGIIPVTLAPEHEGETLTGNFLNESVVDGLKYKSPDITSLVHARLTDEMVNLLDGYIDKSKMSEEHRKVWDAQKYHCETESDVDSDECSLGENDISNNEPSVGSVSEDSDTESECDSEGSVTLGEINSQSFDTISECDSGDLDGIE